MLVRILAAAALSCLALACGGPPAEQAPTVARAPVPASVASPQIAGKQPWQPPDPARWTASTAGYTSFLRGRRQLPLGARAVAVATYLNGVHNRVHPFFGDWILSSLDRLPKDDPLNDPRLVTKLEIIFDAEGRIVRMGVARASGNSVFDLAAVDAFDRAQPFPSPPPEVLSSDGHVYVSWELHRDEVYSCSTMNARPFLLDAIR